MAPTSTQGKTLRTWIVSSSVMPQSARILTTVCPKPAVSLHDCQKEYGRVTRSASPRKSRYRQPSSFLPFLYGAKTCIRYRKLIRLLEQFLSTLLAFHSWHQMARLRVKRRSHQESQPAQHRVHLASGAAALGWPGLKDGRHTHAQSSLLRRAPRRKAW